MSGLVLRWPRRDNLLYNGRNGTGYQTGISIREGGTDKSGLYLDLVPINSRGYGSNCSVTLPCDYMTLMELSDYLRHQADLCLEQGGKIVIQPNKEKSA
jgi:hypothetical protein